jgi:hypothetical protein
VVQCFSWHITSSISRGFGGLEIALSINKVHYSIMDLTRIGLDYTRDGTIILGKISISSILTIIGHCSIGEGITHSWFVIGMKNGNWWKIGGQDQCVIGCCIGSSTRINVQTFVVVIYLLCSKDFKDEIQNRGRIMLGHK